jgi:hypothetical protein
MALVASAAPTLIGLAATIKSATQQIQALDPLIEQTATEVKNFSETIKSPLQEVSKSLVSASETVSSITEPIQILNDKAEIDEIVKNKVIDDTKTAIQKSKTTEEMNNAILIGETKLEKIGQIGGKKILSRTNKSIAQFLNSKVTFQSILKRMTIKYKKRKGLKQRTKRRLHKR